VVRKTRNLITRKLCIKKLKVGHAGALDPLATGLMILCTGKATRSIEQWMSSDKEYIATFEIGRTTPSFDLETETDATYPTAHISREKVLHVLSRFAGPQMQVPPVFSAKNLQGKRAYELARKGIEIQMQAQPITLHRLDLVDFTLPFLTVRVLCSKGTYIRSLARDLGTALESGACLTALRRTASGPFGVSPALTPEAFESLLKDMPPLHQTDNQSVSI